MIPAVLEAGYVGAEVTARDWAMLVHKGFYGVVINKRQYLLILGSARDLRYQLLSHFSAVPQLLLNHYF